MLGLTRADIDCLHARVEVRRQIQEVSGLGRVVGPPKQGSPPRTVIVPQMVANELEQHMEKYSQSGPAGLVFTGPHGGALYRSCLSRAWGSALEKTGLKGLELHVHDLRHHGATVAARAPGITTKELMARIGHRSPRAALIYQHATEDRDRVVASYLASIHRVTPADRMPMAGRLRRTRARC